MRINIHAELHLYCIPIGPLKGNGIFFSPLATLTQIVLVWSLHLYGAGSRANKLYNMADEIRSMYSVEPHKNNMDKEKQRKLATGRYDSQRIHTVVP